MSKRRSSVQRTSKRKGGTSIGSLIPFGLGSIILAAVVGYMIIQPPPTDPKTFCPQDNSNIGMTALLIDVSDKITNSQVARLENELKHISTISKNQSSSFLEKGEKLLVYFVEPEGQVPSLVFSMCHPGDIANRSVADELSEGAIFAQKKWQKFTSDIITSIENKIDGSKEMSTSPIIEAIQYIRAENFPPPRLMSEASNQRMIIWSDLLQNSSEGNHFKRLGDYNEILKQNPTELSGIEVSIFQITSKKYGRYQTNEHTAWWRKLFAKAKADMNMWEKI